MALDSATVFDEADLNAFADGRLEPSRAAALAESLASDRQARARIDTWKRQNDGLRTLFASVLFEPVPVRLLPTTVDAGTAAISLARPERRGAAGGPQSGLLATTAFGMALVGFMAGALTALATDGFGRSGWGLRGGEVRATVGRPSSLAERAAESYRAALADPVRTGDGAADEARFQRWMSRELSGQARIPDLRQQGWKLIGGRVVPGRYAPAAFLTYGSGPDRLGLYLARDPVGAPEQTTEFAEGALTVSAWTEDGLGTAIAAPSRGQNGVEAVRDAIRRQASAEQPSAP